MILNREFADEKNFYYNQKQNKPKNHLERRKYKKRRRKKSIMRPFRLLEFYDETIQ